MQPGHPVLLVTSDPATRTAVRSALESDRRFANAGVCKDLSELVAHLERAPAPGVLVDIDPQPSGLLGSLDPIIKRFEDSRFIILSGIQRDGLVLEAMQAGARHFLTKESIGPHLVGALRRLIPNGFPQGQKQGMVITVLGAGGGCGATTVAINLANELGIESSEPALLVDLDDHYGAVGTYLGLEGDFGIGDVLANSKRIDADLVNSTALDYSESLRALISPFSTGHAEPEPMRFAHLGPALEALLQASRHTVIDAPRVPTSVAAGLAHASRFTLIVLQLNVKDIGVARKMLSDLGRRGVPTDRLVLLANRYRRRHSMITFKEAQNAFGDIPLGHISNDFQGASRCINYGQPLAQAAPRSALRRDIRQLAIELSEAHSSNNRAAAIKVNRE